MLFRGLLYLGLCFLVSGECFAQANFDIFQYRYVGPTRGGRVTAVAGVASQPSTFYMGATGGGVWKTEDYGTTWKNSSDGYFSTPSIGAIQVAENDPNIIYVGTGSDGLRSNVITGKGIYKSIDAGESWQLSGLEKVGQIGAVEIHPQDHNTVFVAAIGQAFQANKERGVYRTTDGGVSWKNVLHISDTTGMVDLEFMPSNPNVIYAAAWRAERKPWTIISGGKESGIYKSINGGEQWKKIGQGLPSLMGKIDLAVSPADSKILYALVESPGKDAGLYRSVDQGENFKQVSDEHGLLDRPFYYCNVEADPNNAEVVYVNSTRFYKSTNGGKAWTRVRTPHGDNHDMWINPNDSKLFVQGNDGGANVTHNGGKTWSTQLNQPTAEIYQVEVDNQHPYWLYGGQQDNRSTVSVPSVPPTRNHQAGGLGYVMETGGCETGPAVPNPENPNIVYSNCKGRFSVFNKTTGQEQQYNVGLRNMYGHHTKDLKFRFQRVSPIHVSPHDAEVIYHTSQYVHKTMDEGKTWEIISPDLTAFEADKQMRSGSPITNDITGEEFYSTIYAIKESPKKQGVIWVGANDGPIHVTQDGGQNWKKVTPKSLAGGGRVDCVEPSAHDPAKVYFSVLRYQLGDWKPYIYKSTNYGNSWELLTNGSNGIPNDYPVRVVREDPIQPGLLYAGTEFGMFISLDDGKKWAPFQQNLPVTPITDLKIHRGDLVLSTMGRGFQLIDNISTLRQEFAALKENKATLFQPKNTYRYRYYPAGVHSAIEHNYPAPAVIVDYFLPQKTEEPFLLQIKNAAGKTIRTFSPTDLTKEEVAVRDMSSETISYSINTKLKNKKGLHRFRWDMRHAGIWDADAKDAYRNGPMVAPGTYTVVLQLGATQLEQSFELLADPRIIESGITLEEIQAQESLALQVVDLLSKAKKEAFSVEEKLEKLTGNSPQKTELENLKNSLVQSKGRYTQPKLISQIWYLYGGVNRADQMPGKVAYERYKELVKELAELVD